MSDDKLEFGCGAGGCPLGAAALGGVGFGGDTRGGLLAQADVAAEAGQVLVAALGLQLRGGPSGLREMLQRSVSQMCGAVGRG